MIKTILRCGGFLIPSENKLRVKKAEGETEWLASTCCADASKRTGKWYFEFRLINHIAVENSVLFGIIPTDFNINNDGYVGKTGVNLGGDSISSNGTGGYGSSVLNMTNRFYTGDVIGVAFDLDSANGDMYLYKNGVFQGLCMSAFKSKYEDGRIIFAASLRATDEEIEFNFGDTPFTYAIPEGYKAWDGEYGPTGLTAIGEDKSVRLFWNYDNVNKYNIKRATTAGGPYITLVSYVPTNSYEDSDVINGATYYYVVTSITNGVESGNSNEASATPSAPVVEDGDGILRVTMIDSSEREYKLPMEEIDNFVNWFIRPIGTGTTAYVLKKLLPNSKAYLVFDKIISFEVSKQI